MIPAAEALERLRAGNQRFVAGESTADSLASSTKRRELVQGQDPFAIILGCADSRVPAGQVFDQGLGDLFTIRVAGNIVAPSQIASIEYCAEQFKTQLVVVLGHTHCGAIQATLSELKLPPADRSKNLHSIVDRIRPSVENLLDTDLANDHDQLMDAAVRANVRGGVAQLQQQSEILKQLTITNGLEIIGARYSLESGEVEFFDQD